MDRPSVSQTTEWQRIGNQIDTASIFARVYFVTVPSWLSGVNPKCKMCRVSGQFQLIFSVMSDTPRSVALCVVVVCFASVALADDFKTIQGKEYKNVTVTRVEPDGIVLESKSGISKVYFVELPKDVQERFHYGSATPTGKAVTQRIDKAESANHATASFDAGTFADRFAQRVEKQLDERESILQGKHTPGSAELMAIRELNWHKAFLAGTGIIAIVLFAIVWARVK